jgi:glycosyltransferase involved in cell wall biosynthesis
MKKRNILYVIENECYGGGERAFAQLINGLDKEKYAVYAACLPRSAGTASEPFADEIGRSSELIPFDMRSLISPLNIFRLAGIIRERKVDLVHSQGARANFYARAAANLAEKVALVSTIASPVGEYNIGPLKKAAYLAFDRFCEASVDKFIAVAGHIERKLARDRRIPAQKVARIYNGIESEKFIYAPAEEASFRAELNIGRDVFLVGAFCRLSREKGLSYLVEAARKIRDAESGPAAVKYLIAGEGELEKSLKAKVKSFGLDDDFIFTGFLKDVRPALSAVDIMVLPSLREGFPMSVLEAMAMGKPVVAFRIEGVDESVLDGVSGLLVPSGDSGALAAAITNLHLNRDKRLAMGASGKNLVTANFGLDRTIKEHERVYEELLKA